MRVMQTIVPCIAGLALAACSKAVPPIPADAPCSGFVANLSYPDAKTSAADIVSVTNFDRQNWSGGSEPSHGKHGSGISIYYRFKERTATEWDMELALSDVQREASAVSIRGIDGAGLQGNTSGTYWLLKAGVVSRLNLLVSAKETGGAVVVSTCQAGKVSTRSIVLPGRQITAAPSPGQYTLDGAGNATIRMQAQPASASKVNESQLP